MEQNTKIIIAAIGLGGLGYYLYKKGFFGNASIAQVQPIPPTIVPSKPVVKIPTYPMGIGKDGSMFELKEGDYVANGEETAVLYGGELRPITKAYADKFTWGTWDRTKILDNVVYRSIPRGAVLDA
jgi:hypothetical protein